MSNMNTDCARVQMLLEEYFEGTLPAREEGQVSAHISWCHVCAGELAQIAKIAAALEAVPLAEPSPELLRAISSRVAELPAPAERRRVFAGWGRLALYGAGLVVVLAGLSLLLPIAWGKYSYLATPVVAFGHRALAVGGFLVSSLYDAIIALGPAAKALGHVLRLSVPTVAPVVAIHVLGEVALMILVILACRRFRRRPVQVQFASRV